MGKIKSITIIGAGNLATNLAKELQRRGFFIPLVYSRTLESAKKLGETLQTDYTNRIENVSQDSDSDAYIFSIKDSAIEKVLEQLGKKKKLYIHTAGSVPSDIFKPYSDRYGVLYPLQTFSKDRELSFEEIPLFIEANKRESEQQIKEIAATLSERVIYLSSEKRRFLHLAATFACNFSNHMYTLAARILEKEELNYSYLLPLICETFEKTKEKDPFLCQTGPARRNDKETIRKHLALLEEDKNMQTIYQTITNSILSLYAKEEE